MSKRLRQCSSYLKIILSGNSLQSEAVLVTASDAQVDCLSEIIMNVQRLPVKTKTKALLIQHKKILDIVSDSKIPVERRLKIIQKESSVLLQVLMSVKKKLLFLL